MTEPVEAGANEKGVLFRCPEHSEVFGPKQTYTRCYGCAGERHPENFEGLTDEDQAKARAVLEEQAKARAALETP